MAHRYWEKPYMSCLSIRQMNNWTRGKWYLLALGLAFAAQSLFTNQPFRPPVPAAWSPESRLNVGIGLLLAAVACSAWATFQPTPSRSDAENAATLRPSVLDALRAARPTNYVAPALIASCYFVSLVLYLVVGESSWVRILWLAGVIILLISQRPVTAIRSDRERIKWWEWWLVTAVTAIGFSLRYWRLTEIPSHIDNDVALMGTYSLDFIRNSYANWIGVVENGHMTAC
jgi:hypothetical protein